MNRLIIDNPTGASWIQRFSQRAITLAFWVVFGFLFRPLLTLLAWLVGGHFFSRAMIQNQGYQALITSAGFYLLVIALIVSLLIGWALYNLLRFRNNERRTRQPDPVTAAEQAAFYGLDEATVRQLQGANRLVLHIDENGLPVVSPPSRTDTIDCEG